MAANLDQAIALFQDGQIEKAAHLLASLRRWSAVETDEEQRLAEIDDVIGQMRAHLSGEERNAFDSALAGESASWRPHSEGNSGTRPAARPAPARRLRRIARPVGWTAAVGALVLVLVPALGHFWWFAGKPCSDDAWLTIKPDGSDRHRVPRDLEQNFSWSGNDPKRSPDGRKIAFYTKEGRLVVVNSDSSIGKQVANRIGLDSGYEDFAWSPDSREIVTVIGKGEDVVGVVDLHGRLIRRISSGVVTGSVAWAPSNRIAVFQYLGDDNQDKCGD